MFPETLSERIKYLREKNNLTYEEVGRHVGVGKSTVHKWETGYIANMKRDKIEKLAEALHTSPAYLMGWAEDPAETKKESASLTDDELTNSIYNLLGQLTPSELEKVAAFVQGLLASH